ncbi:MAG TPA: 16S rRNA (uracil(1498)-N(3))-methyltransferase, partial [Gammaproteobacteria bacterium]|nr:16S rRNA (uracil(1498)-N(3))-methyltransferase [Gammaproteobacteria bacterium]
KFEENGFRSVTLGPRILRVENALTAIIARLYPN